MDLLLDKLNELKMNYHAVGVKAEFESEGSTLEDTIKLQKLASLVNLDLTVKIGGCGALKDIYDIRDIGVCSIVAPMIESKYAMEKFIQTTQTALSQEELEKIKLYINIETISGYNAIDEILSSDTQKYITGIVFGRGDMAESLGAKNVESDTLLEMAKTISEKSFGYNKELIVGGKITPQSLGFLDQIELSKVETRKIIFDSNITSEGILKAIEFEIMWIDNKQIKHEEDKKRQKELEYRYEKFIDVRRDFDIRNVNEISECLKSEQLQSDVESVESCDTRLENLCIRKFY